MQWNITIDDLKLSFYIWLVDSYIQRDKIRHFNQEFKNLVNLISQTHEASPT